MDGIYIHIPFCVKKCPYCDFYSMPCKDDLMDKFTAQTVNLIKNYNKNIIADTVYFGGGTPTTLGEKALEKILSAAIKQFNVDKNNAEITIEANPCTLTQDYLNNLRKIGFNRLSMGFQSGNDDELKLLGRAHSKNEAVEAFNMARKAGFNNISLDIMLGLPNQSVLDAKKSAIEIIKLNPEHISAYLLKIEKGTAFDKIYKSDENFEDNQAEIYEEICNVMKENGYEHYEISNFCKKGFESKHNTKYWKLDNYLGIGPSAHSKLFNKRFYMKKSINEYLQGANVDDLLIFEDYADDYEEYVMLRLRLKEGISIKALNELYPDNSADFTEKIKPMIKNGMIIKNDDNVFLSDKGFLISNYIISRLI